MPRISNTTLARVMTPIALRPGFYSQTALAEKTRLNEAGISRAATALVIKDWAQESSELRTAPGRPQKLYAPTSRFMSVVENTVRYVHEAVPEREQQLFDKAVTLRAEADSTYGEEEYDERIAGYLGKATLLGEREDLSEQGWFGGAIGWRALIEIVASGQGIRSEDSI